MDDGKGTISFSEHNPHDVASCNVCYARNYDPCVKPAIGRKVDRLFDMRVGGNSYAQIVLCGECMVRLFLSLETFIKTNGEYEVSTEAKP